MRQIPKGLRLNEGKQPGFLLLNVYLGHNDPAHILFRTLESFSFHGDADDSLPRSSTSYFNLFFVI